MNSVDYTIILDKYTSLYDDIIYFKKIESSLLDTRLVDHIIQHDHLDVVYTSNFVTLHLLANHIKDLSYDTNLLIIDKSYYNKSNLEKIDHFIKTKNPIIFSTNNICLYATKQYIDQFLQVPYILQNRWYDDIESINANILCLENFDSWESVFG